MKKEQKHLVETRRIETETTSYMQVRTGLKSGWVAVGGRPVAGGGYHEGGCRTRTVCGDYGCREQTVCT
jgi:hypothetical protein